MLRAIGVATLASPGAVADSGWWLTVADGILKIGVATFATLVRRTSLGSPVRASQGVTTTRIGQR